jgi:RNA recognition motif-containing protein
MEDRAGGQSAIDNLDGSELEGRKLVVNEARPKPARR